MRGIMDKRYVLIDTDEKFQEAVDHLNSVEYVAYDTETTGLNVRKEEVIGFSFTGSVKLGYYLPLYQWNTKSFTSIESGLTASLEPCSKLRRNARVSFAC